MIPTVEAVEMMAKRIRTARAAQNRAAVDSLTAKYARLGIQLGYALQRCHEALYGAACRNNAQRLRELRQRYLELREVLIEWRLVAEELDVFSRASAIGSVGGGDGCCCPSPVAASFASEEASDA